MVECETGYLINGLANKCIKCNSGSSSCHYEPSTPKSCLDGFTVYEGSCTQCIENGKSCSILLSGETRITECLDGYAVATDNLSCVKCGNHAKKCSLTVNDEVKEIEECEEGYILANDGDASTC